MTIILYPTLTIIVVEIFMFQIEYSFPFSVMKPILIIKNDCRYYSSEPIGGNQNLSNGHINNNFIKLLSISSIFIVLTLLEFSNVDVIFGRRGNNYHPGW